MPLEKALVHRHRLHRADRGVEDDLLDTIDQQHRITVRQRRHDPRNVHRAHDGLRFVSHGGYYRPLF